MLLLLSWLIVFSAVSIKASATEEIISSSPVDIRSFYGDSISFSYFFNGVEYTDSFSYLKTKNGGTNVQFSYVDIENNNVANNGYTFGSYDYLVYRCQTGRANAYLIDVSVSGIYTYYSGYVRGGFGMSVWPVSFSIPNNSYNTIASYPDNYVGSNQAQSANTNSDLYNWAWMPSDTYSISGSSAYLACRWNLFFSQNGFIVDDISFSGVQTNNYGELFFVIMCPVYGGDMSNSDPSQTTTTTDSGSGSVTTVSGGDINVDVNIDLDETNSILEDILEGISSFVTDIIEGVVYIFKPMDDDYIENWLDDMADVISEAFSDKVDIDILRDMLIDLGSYGATTSIEFPSFSIGDNTFPARAVALRPSGFDTLFNLVETAVNLVCTIWVFNMVLMRIKAVFVGESVVEVEGDVE